MKKHRDGHGDTRVDLYSMKSYLTLDEAALRLSTPGQSMTRRDILDLAMRERLRLTFFYEGELHRFQVRLDGEYVDPSEHGQEGWHVFTKGYFLVPAWEVTPESLEFNISDMRPVEKPVWSSRAWRTGAPGYVLGGCFAECEDEIMHRPICVSSSNVLVPLSDIEALEIARPTGPIGHERNLGTIVDVVKVPLEITADSDIGRYTDLQQAQEKAYPDLYNPASSTGSRIRSDDLAIEIDVVVAQLVADGVSPKASNVMPRLVKRAGIPSSCIDAEKPEGVAWTNSRTNKTKVLTMAVLHKRLSRAAKAKHAATRHSITNPATP